MRPKLSINQQIEDMKDAGITFNIMTEIEANRYLEQNTYYFRLKAYAKNYDKYTGTEKEGQYINLDFAYLVDLFEIDDALKKIILEMTYELEYFLKVKLLSDFNMSHEDGYEIVEELFKMQPTLNDSIEQKLDAPLCRELIKKYHKQWAIWNIVEVLTLGEFINLYQLFYNRNKYKDSYLSLLLPMKVIRNAAAHNNCLIYHLKAPFSGVVKTNYELRNELTQNAKIPRESLNKRLAHPAINDFSAMLFLYSKVVPAEKSAQTHSKLKNLFFGRMVENKEYYKKNDSLCQYYEFALKIIKHFVS